MFGCWGEKGQQKSNLHRIDKFSIGWKVFGQENRPIEIENVCHVKVLANNWELATQFELATISNSPNVHQTSLNLWLQKIAPSESNQIELLLFSLQWQNNQQIMLRVCCQKYSFLHEVERLSSTKVVQSPHQRLQMALQWNNFYFNSICGLLP